MHLFTAFMEFLGGLVYLIHVYAHILYFCRSLIYMVSHAEFPHYRVVIKCKLFIFSKLEFGLLDLNHRFIDLNHISLTAHELKIRVQNL
ncbi:hypothetical protein Scep_020382 [Stephania cephalantha]|uniref:Uncharacterized protein n=1 Tax=Stephania cephalantha TaxID=152367 RepID=A0AAP0ID33_9MAGN